MSKELMKQAAEDLEKLAAFEMNAATKPAAMKFLKSVMTPVAIALAGTAAAAGAGYYVGKSREEDHNRALSNSYGATFHKHDSFKKSPDSYMQRFHELSAISPTIAKNPNLASKVLQQKLNRGFSIDDIHRLSSIEYNSRMGGGHGPAGGSATAQAAAQQAFGKIVDLFGRDVVHGFKPALNQYNADITAPSKARAKKIEQDLRTGMESPELDAGIDDLIADSVARASADIQSRKGGHNKQSSENPLGLLVSEECLGNMLGERFSMLKTAGFWGTAGKNLVSGGTNLIQSTIPYMASTVALAGGVQLMRNVLENRKNAALHAEADLAFNRLKGSSEIIQGSPDAAREAFTTLKMFAPSLAARPQVMQTFVEHVINTGERLPFETIQSMANAEGAVRGIGAKPLNENPFLGGFASPLEHFAVDHPKTETKGKVHGRSSRFLKGLGH